MDLLKQQQELYNQLMELVQSFQSAAGSRSDTEERLQFNMQQVSQIDAKISQLRPELERNGSLKSPAVQQAVTEQEQILRSLIGQVDASLGHVNQQQQELTQSLDGNVSRDTMQAAYRVSMRTG